MKFFYCDSEKFLEILGNYRQEANNIFGFRTFFSNFLLVKCSHVVPCVPLMNVIRDRECFLSPCSLCDKKRHSKLIILQLSTKLQEVEILHFFREKWRFKQSRTWPLIGVCNHCSKNFSWKFSESFTFQKIEKNFAYIEGFRESLNVLTFIFKK